MLTMKWLVIGSQTRASRAQEVLAGAGISAQRRKLTGRGEGCSYAVGVSDFAVRRAVSLIEGAGIRIKEEIQSPE